MRSTKRWARIRMHVHATKPNQVVANSLDLNLNETRPRVTASQRLRSGGEPNSATSQLRQHEVASGPKITTAGNDNKARLHTEQRKPDTTGCEVKSTTGAATRRSLGQNPKQPCKQVNCEQRSNCASPAEGATAPRPNGVAPYHTKQPGARVLNQL